MNAAQRVLIALALLAIATSAVELTLDNVPELARLNGGVFTRSEVKSLFRQFEARFGAVQQHERQSRMEIFASNLVRGAELCRLHEYKAVFGVTKFAALSAAEFKARYLTARIPESLDSLPVLPESAAALPSTYSLVGQTPQVVSAVMDEGQCGSTWAMAAVQNAMSVWAVAGNTFTELSVQQVAACDTVSSGCNGGWPVSAMQYSVKSGLESAAAYPYRPVNTKCQYNAAKVVATFKGWHRVTKSKNETAILASVQSLGAVSVAVDAQSWQLYTSGVIQAKGCGLEIDHVVTVVGWAGVPNSAAPHYVVENIWGVDWGMDGFAELEFGANACGVTSVPITLTVSEEGTSSGASGASASGFSSQSSGSSNGARAPKVGGTAGGRLHK